VLFAGCRFMYLVVGVIGLCCWASGKTTTATATTIAATTTATASYVDCPQSTLQREEEQRRQEEQTPHFFCQLTPVIPYYGPKPKRWNTSVQWDPHLIPPTHGYYLMRDYQCTKRFVNRPTLLRQTLLDGTLSSSISLLM
jgi:hypothetical protein